MSLSVLPIDMIAPVNYYAPLPNTQWVITDPNAVTLWLQLDITDTLGTRRYIAATGSTLTATFQRRDKLHQRVISPLYPSGQLIAQPQSISIYCTVNGIDGSLWTMALNPGNIQTIVSGTILFALTENGVVTSWAQDWVIQKNLTTAGC
jgi:hypothetical protein